MQIGTKYNLVHDPLPACEWLTLPHFRMGQPQTSQSLHHAIVALKDTGYKLHGHPLINLRKHPNVEYVRDLDDFLFGVTENFENLIDSWDVLNECSNYNDDVWGNYWQSKVLEMMRDLCPGAKLFINEYAIQNSEYWDGVLALAEKLKDDGLLDGVGIQCRTDITERVSPLFDYGASLLVAPIPTPKLTNAIKAIHGMGLDCHLSEVQCLHGEGQEKTAQAVIARYRKTAEDNNVHRFTYWPW